MKTLATLTLAVWGLMASAQNIPIIGAVMPGNVNNVMSTTGLTNATTLTLKNTGKATLQFTISSAPNTVGSTGVTVAANSQLDATLAQLGGIGSGQYLNVVNKAVGNLLVGIYNVLAKGPGTGLGSTCNAIQNLVPNWAVDALNKKLYVCPTNTMVGIGTTMPSYQLDVWGNTHVLTDLSVGNGISAGSNISTTAALFSTQLSVNHSSSGANYDYAALINVDNDNTKGLAVQNASGDMFSVLGDGTVRVMNNIGVGPNADAQFSNFRLNVDGGSYFNGSVAIGTTTPDPGYRLSVNGDIRCKRAKVETGWSDFVFEKDYELMSLTALEAYIEANHHLPEIPAASEVEDNGADVGEMLKKQMQKIEELTLYVIQQQKEIETLKQRLDKK